LPWKQTTKVGKSLKKLTLVYKKTTSDEFVDYLKPKLHNFARHNFVSRWQDRQFKSSIKYFPAKIVVYVVDFAKNYTFETQNEVQSMHWHSYQISILVHITYQHNPQPDPYDEESWVFIGYHFYIFDNWKHDSKFVQHCFKLHWEHMVANGYAPKWHWVWNDSCASQFKSSKPWFFVSKYPNFIKGCKMLWSFFGNGHGKGPHDGVGAMIKRFL
jgi:hypothetical protein